MQTSESFISFIKSLLERPSDIRQGQHLFNMLSSYNNHLADIIVDTEYDPFYNDSNIEACLQYIIKNWTAYD